VLAYQDHHQRLAERHLLVSVCLLIARRGANTAHKPIDADAAS